MTDFHVIIPARYGSTRLAAKALADISGKPMVQHTWERAIKSGALSVTIATDDERIKQCATCFGANVCMTRQDHQSGSSRLAEATNLLNFQSDEIVINVQGDEPFIPPVIISQVASALAAQKLADMATLASEISEVEEVFNPSVCKVVLDKNNFALYFSRAPIAWERDNFSIANNNFLSSTLKFPHYKHIGIYAYRVAFLQSYAAATPSYLETCETLEQLRILWHGGKIYVGFAKETSPVSVDTAKDLAAARHIAQNMN